MKLIRYLLGRIILFLDWATSPKSMVRSQAEQSLVDEKLSVLRLYELQACPFCVKVRRECKRLGLTIERINVKDDAADLRELESVGGKYQVPCLRISNEDGSSEWMYESSVIIDYLRREFGAQANSPLTSES